MPPERVAAPSGNQLPIVGKEYRILVVGEYGHLVVVRPGETDLPHHNGLLALLPTQHCGHGGRDVVVQYPEHSGGRYIRAGNLHVCGRQIWVCLDDLLRGEAVLEPIDDGLNGEAGPCEDFLASPPTAALFDLAEVVGGAAGRLPDACPDRDRGAP